MTILCTHNIDSCLICSDLVLDVRDLLCPLPVLKTKACMHRVKVGDVIEILFSDEGTHTELCLFAQTHSHNVLDLQKTDSGWVMRLQK